MTRADKIQSYLIKTTSQLSLNRQSIDLAPLMIESIAQNTGIASSNVSMELGRLFRTGKLVKICGRPVYYLSLPSLEEKLDYHLDSNEYDRLADFLSAITHTKDSRTAGRKRGEHPAALDGELNPLTDSEFDHLIGQKKSLANHISKAKAAILYPPHGLHALITGPTGVGKTQFARGMYDFAVKSHILNAKASFVTLNCATYAENPQLLLSQLFGYVKGSFTGAVRDHPGMVEYADGGILFLDEIHRLNPESQEKLFHLMDYGTFNRLGETDRERHVQVLIIGATTSDPDEIMLNTFQRRIPVQITLPALQERSLEERVELVLYFLWKEAKNLKKRISIDFSILCALCYYECKANIGQLSSDIKLACANAYFEYLIDTEKKMALLPRHLHERILQGLFISNNGNNPLMREILTSTDTIVLDGFRDFNDLLFQVLSPS